MTTVLNLEVLLPSQFYCFITIESSKTIKDIKDIIYNKTKYPPNKQELLFKFTRLEDDIAIDKYKLPNHCMLRCYVLSDEKEVLFIKSKAVIDSSGYIRDQTYEIGKDKEIALTAFKDFIRFNKDTQMKPQKMNNKQFEKMLIYKGEPIQPILVKQIVKELDIKSDTNMETVPDTSSETPNGPETAGVKQFDEQKMLIYFQEGIMNY